MSQQIGHITIDILKGISTSKLIYTLSLSFIKKIKYFIKYGFNTLKLIK